MLRKSVLEVTQRAKASQALRPITAGHELLPASENGVRYLLFSANASNRKPVGQAGEKKEGAKPTEFRDPFAAEHLEQDLFVTRVHDTHNLVLNKFCIVEEHVVLPTIAYEQQETPLSTADFRAMWTAMRGLDAFAFFNCGYESGASQPHKHMQLNSYPSFKQFTGLDMPPLLHFIDQKLKEHPTTHAMHLPELPFFHFLHRLDFAPDTSSTDAAAYLARIYGEILKAMDQIQFPDRPAAADGLPVAYNLLLTESFLFVIPRKTQRFEGIEVNSIGFIGSFFVRDSTQHAQLLAKGPMELLREVTFPPSLASSL